MMGEHEPTEVHNDPKHTTAFPPAGPLGGGMRDHYPALASPRQDTNTLKTKPIPRFGIKKGSSSLDRGDNPYKFYSDIFGI